MDYDKCSWIMVYGFCSYFVDYVNVLWVLLTSSLLCYCFIDYVNVLWIMLMFPLLFLDYVNVLWIMSMFYGFCLFCGLC